MLGLKRHTVAVVDHDPGWLAAGMHECQTLRQLGGGLIIDAQHVGSTSVPDLPAKPILDIAVLIESADRLPALSEKLVTAGYIDRGDCKDDGGHLFVRESQPDIRVAHVHVIVQGDPQWARYLLFRDALRGNATLRTRYANLKHQLAQQHPGDRRSYTAAKNTFIRGLFGDLANNMNNR